MSDELLWVVGGGLVLWAVFSAGRQHESDERERKRKEQQQRDQDLGFLAPTLAEWGSGKLTLEQADARVDMDASFRPSAARLWHSMSLEEKRRFAERAVAMFSNPKFVEQQTRLFDKMREMAPETWAAAEAIETAREKKLAEDALLRDMLKLRASDPAGFQEVKQALLERAAEAKGEGHPHGGT